MHKSRMRRARPNRQVVAGALEVRRLLTAAISGLVFTDTNGDDAPQASEAPLPGRTIYLDLNSNGRRDPGEPSTTSGTDGRYRFSGLAPGSYFVAQQVPDGWKMSRPPNDTNSERFVTAADGGPDATANFGSFCRRVGD